MASRQSPLFVDWEVHVALCICLDSGTSIRLDSDHLFFSHLLLHISGLVTMLKFSQ